MMNAKAKPKLTPKCHELFGAYAKDAANWSGNPCVGGNVGGTRSEACMLTHMKRAGLISTSRSDGCTWIHFTEAGRAYAVVNFGIDPAPQWVDANTQRHMGLEEAKSL